ncbi:sigma-54-dependent transcriptional regulator [Aliikangiella sp. IMCC44359]|uniref:sigma-54-dependent transcriptional regulator n=1 Tax=Aliikangiella sp. IMCC44359 TaxID=3459125 RepID=UPI00403AF457
MSQILVIDDNQGIATALDVLFSIYDISMLHADSPQEGLRLLQTNDISLVIQDMNFSEDTTSGEEGRTLFNTINATYPDIPVILLTAWGNIEMAVELVKAGAADYLTKPWDDNKLIATIKNLMELSQLRQQTNTLLSEKSQQTSTLSAQFNLCGTIFCSEAMLQSLTMATQIAHANIPVLITGPNGSGKEKIAEVIQANSGVQDKPFVKVNVGALPIELLEAELFGAEAGAFTGAKKRRIGRFEMADGGTLFLDEIGNLPLSGQVKLLRVIQTGEFERLGSSETLKVDVRIISATNANLLKEIENGNFREDLYYRLNVIEIKAPPLSQRVDDILPLTLHFMPEDLTLSKDAENTLLSYHWPGNVRELENVVQRASLLAQNKKIEVFNLGLPEIKKDKKIPTVIEPDKETLTQILQANRNNISQTAKQLGLSRQSLYRRMNKYGIDKKDS